MLHSLRRFSKDEVARERERILRFYKSYGEKATGEAFGVDRKLICVWKKRLKDSEGHLMALIPDSTRPHRVRTMQSDERIIMFIKGMRQEHPALQRKVGPLSGFL